MKLKEIKNNFILHEGRVDPNVLLSISNIIKDSKVSDSFQYLMLYRIIEMIKFGLFYNEVNFYKSPSSYKKDEIPSQVEIITILKSLPQEKLVELAKVFYDMLTTKNRDELNSYCNTSQSILDWIHFVTSKDANQ